MGVAMWMYTNMRTQSKSPAVWLAQENKDNWGKKLVRRNPELDYWNKLDIGQLGTELMSLGPGCG